MTEPFRNIDPIEIDGGPEGVLLRELTIDDAQRYADLIAYDREHFRSVGEPTADRYQSKEDVEKSFERVSEKVRFGIWVDGVMVGSINYSPRANNTAEIGYWIGKQYTRHGSAAKATRVLIDHLFGQGYASVDAWARQDNTASRKTLVSAGMEEWGPDPHDSAHIQYGRRNPAFAS